MVNFTTLSYCFWSGKSWDVTCNRCCAFIGTFTSSGVREAVFRTAHRGGIMCPDCRAKACKGCGAEMEEREMIIAEGQPGDVCWFCLGDAEERIHFSACLVSHNSKTLAAIEEKVKANLPPGKTEMGVSGG